MDRGIAAGLLRERFPQSVEKVEEFRGETSVTVGSGALREALAFLRDDPRLCFDLLLDLAGVDFAGRVPRFMVAYQLHSTKSNDRVRIRVTAAEGASLPTVSDLFLTADWMEREVYDLLGIRFDGHPNLVRILLPEDFSGHPLRKDFPVKGNDFDQPFPVCLEEER